MNISIDDIQNVVAGHFGVNPKAMSNACQSRKVVRPRQVAMYLARKLTNQSFPQIGRMFNRNHTTVIHAVQMVERLQRENCGLAAEIAEMSSLLRGTQGDTLEALAQ